MDKLSDILQRSLNKKGIGREALAAEICYFASQIGGQLFEPVSFSRYELKVRSKSSSAASEVQMMKDDIIEKINKKLGKNIVRSIRIVNIS